MSQAFTTYRVEDSRGIVEYLGDSERAERLSRAGFTVTATTEATP